MSETIETERNDVREDGRRPPRAVVGSHRVEEEIFGKVFDGKIVRRIWTFVSPYRRQIYISVGAVLLFTGSQIVIPLVIRYAIDHAMAPGAINYSALWLALAIFTAAQATCRKPVSARWRKKCSSISAGRCSRICSGYHSPSWTRPKSAG
jgi:ATP-binding cassette subfamily B multidrug efflux pump